MISFCGSSIREKDVLDVYGLAAPAQIETIGKALAGADYRAIISLVDELADEGRDLYRVLNDLEDFLRGALLEAIRKGGSSEQLGSRLSTESLMRMLDALRSGETGVQKGLSQRVNFEVTLLKAAEHSRSRSIDTLIKEIGGLAPALDETDVAKKK